MNTPIAGEILGAAAFHVLDPRARDAGAVAEHFVERAVPADANVALVVRLRHQLVDEDRLGAELVATVDHGHRARDVRQIERLLDRGIAAADDHDVLALVEEAVAGAHAETPLPMNASSDGRPR
jgi:hypothetical protein